MATGIPSNFANAVAPFVPLGRTPIGEEMPDLRQSTLKPLEPSAESARDENFRSPDQRPNDTEAQLWLRRRQQRSQNADQPPAEETLTFSVSGRAALAAEREAGLERKSEGATGKDAGEGSEPRQVRERRQALDERAVIRELAARDREVRLHEQAHAALGGRHAGAPRYQYERGPDGVAYAVSGEVPIDTSKVPNDPRATIEKARQIRRAAFAPAEPSDTDRRVAAAAARLEAEARVELRQQQRQEALQSTSAEGESSTDFGPASEQRAERDSDSRTRMDDDNESERRELSEAMRRRNRHNVQTYIQLGEIAAQSRHASGQDWRV